MSDVVAAVQTSLSVNHGYKSREPHEVREHGALLHEGGNHVPNQRTRFQANNQLSKLKRKRLPGQGAFSIRTQ